MVLRNGRVSAVRSTLSALLRMVSEVDGVVRRCAVCGVRDQDRVHENNRFTPLERVQRANSVPALDFARSADSAHLLPG